MEFVVCHKKHGHVKLLLHITHKNTKFNPLLGKGNLQNAYFYGFVLENLEIQMKDHTTTRAEIVCG